MQILWELRDKHSLRGRAKKLFAKKAWEGKKSRREHISAEENAF